jgi:hypothetical protein
LRKGNIVPRTTTSTPNAIKSQKDKPLEAGVGVAATGAGVLAGSEDEFSVATGVTAAAAGVLAVSEGELAVTAGEAAA